MSDALSVIAGGFQDWGAQAACKNSDPFIFECLDERDMYAVNTAKRICEGCPVRAQCLAWIMEEEAGLPARYRVLITGGLTPSERAKADMAGARFDYDADRLLPVRVVRTVSHKCRVCGRRVKKKRTFMEMTTVADKDNALKRQQEMAAQWEPERVHDKCKTVARKEAA